MTFTINEQSINTHERPNGLWIARYVHPTVPMRIGLTNWVVATGESEYQAYGRLLALLEGMGGVRSQAVAR